MDYSVRLDGGAFRLPLEGAFVLCGASFIRCYAASKTDLDCLRRSHHLIRLPLRKGLGATDARSIDAEVELLPAAFALAPMLCCRPFAFANDRESSAVDDEMDGFARGDSTEPDVEVLAATRERRVIWR